MPSYNRTNDTVRYELVIAIVRPTFGIGRVADRSRLKLLDGIISFQIRMIKN